MLYQLRTYTLKTAEALEAYADVHWPRHIPSLLSFGIATHGVWTESNSKALRLFALISYSEGTAPIEANRAYMSSPEFARDMEGFDVTDIVNVTELFLVPRVDPSELAAL